MLEVDTGTGFVDLLPAVLGGEPPEARLGRRIGFQEFKHAEGVGSKVARTRKLT